VPALLGLPAAPLVPIPPLPAVPAVLVPAAPPVVLAFPAAPPAAPAAPVPPAPPVSLLFDEEQAASNSASEAPTVRARFMEDTAPSSRKADVGASTFRLGRDQTRAAFSRAARHPNSSLAAPVVAIHGAMVLFFWRPTKKRARFA